MANNFYKIQILIDFICLHKKENLMSCELYSDHLTEI